MAHGLRCRKGVLRFTSLPTVAGRAARPRSLLTLLSRLRERRLSRVFGRFQRLLVLGDHLIPASPPFSSVGLELVGAMEKSDRFLPHRRDVRR